MCHTECDLVEVKITTTWPVSPENRFNPDLYTIVRSSVPFGLPCGGVFAKVVLRTHSIESAAAVGATETSKPSFTTHGKLRKQNVCYELARGSQSYCPNCALSVRRTHRAEVSDVHNTYCALITVYRHEFISSGRSPLVSGYVVGRLAMTFYYCPTRECVSDSKKSPTNCNLMADCTDGAENCTRKSLLGQTKALQVHTSFQSNWQTVDYYY